MLLSTGRFFGTLAPLPSVPILDGTSPTGAWSMSRDLLTSFIGGSRYTDVSGAVSVFTNQTGGDSLVQTGAGSRPAVSTAGPNSRACIDCDGADYVRHPSLSGTGNPYISVGSGYVVVSFIADTITLNNATVYNNHGVVADEDGYTGLYLKNTTGSPETIIAFNWDTAADVATQAVISTGMPYVAEWKHEGGQVSVRVNRGAWTNTASGNTAAAGLLANFHIGSGNVAGLDGKIFEVAVWSTIPDDTTKDAIVADFMAHIGIVVVPNQFGSSDWSVANDGTSGDITITIGTLPWDGGSAIIDLEYQIEGGSWVSLASTTIGVYPVSGLTDDVEVDVAIRAVNAIGNGTESATKAVTPVTATGVWAPADLGAALIGWYKGDDLAGSTDDNIASWPDDSGLANDMVQATSADQPSLVTAGLNGLNVIRFAAANTEFFTLPHLFSGKSAGSMYIVLKRTEDPASTTDTGGSWDFGSETGTRNAFAYTDGNIYEDFGSTARKTCGNPSVALNAWRIFSVSSIVNSFQARVDDGAVFSYSTASNTVGWISTPSFGRTSLLSTRLYLDADVAEVVLTDAVQSTIDRQRMEGYLAHKWGITANLAASHPYKSFAP